MASPFPHDSGERGDHLVAIGRELDPRDTVACCALRIHRGGVDPQHLPAARHQCQVVAVQPARPNPAAR